MSVLKSFKLNSDTQDDDTSATTDLSRTTQSAIPKLNIMPGVIGVKNYSFAKLNKFVIIALKDLNTLIDDMKSNAIPRHEMLFTLHKIVESLSATVDLNNIDAYDSELEDDDNDGSNVPQEVQQWIHNTFMNIEEIPEIKKGKSLSQTKNYFKSLIGIKMKHFKTNFSSEIEEINIEVQDLLNNDRLWQFDIFEVKRICGDNTLKVVLSFFFQKYHLFNTFRIQSKQFNALMNNIIFGYERFNNPYHNSLHGADVIQTTHTLLVLNNFLYYLSPIELFTSLFAAAIHDYDHQGVTNNFIVENKYQLALTYNDFAVQENHHVSSVFKLLRKPPLNITENMSPGQFNEFRTLCIKMVLATDMSQHFVQVKKFNSSIQTNELIKMHDYLAAVLHTADLSNPAKEWTIHVRWVVYLFQEFFSQGDREKSLGVTISPLCDRNSILVYQSQIGFLDFIIQPTFDLFSNISEGILSQYHGNVNKAHMVSRIKPSKRMSNLVIQFKYCNNRPWDVCIMQNRSNWRRKGDKDYIEQKSIIDKKDNFSRQSI